MSLNAEAIVDAGLELLDRYGLGDLSMRRVAETLGVKAGALYYHIPNKQTLLAAIADQILRETATPPDELTPAEWLACWAANLRATMLAHRDGAELVASTSALGLGRVDPAEPARGLLSSLRIDQPVATAAAFMHFVLGHVNAEQTRSQLAELGVVTAFDARAAERDFQHGVDLLIRGVLGEGR